MTSNAMTNTQGLELPKTMTLSEVLAALPQEFKALNLIRMSDRGDFPHYIRASKKSAPIFNRVAVMDWVQQVYGSVLVDYRMEMVTFPFEVWPKPASSCAHPQDAPSLDK